MKSSLPKPDLTLRDHAELSLSGKALAELMVAVVEKGCLFRFRARGWSMAPFIHDGDIISVAPFPGKKARVGEVAAYIQPGTEKLIVHRLIKQASQAWIILGDNNPGEHFEQVPSGSLIGRVVRIERDGKRVWLGLGPERYLIAFLSRARMLIPILSRLRKVVRNLGVVK